MGCFLFGGDFISPKQLRFIDEYVIDHNGTQAAIRSGYSKLTANEISAKLLAKVSIQNFIREKEAEIADRNSVKQDDVIRELKLLAYMSMDDKHMESGMKPSDKIKALELLGRYLGMFQEKTPSSKTEEEKQDLYKDLSEDELRTLAGGDYGDSG